ncbi:MAG: hypothetical protein WCD79_22530 [Chthoniobacteraceae bacterium]
MEIVLLKIWAGFLLLVVISTLVWLYRHQADVRRKIIENGIMPREAVRGNVLVLAFAGGVTIIGLLLHLLID